MKKALKILLAVVVLTVVGIIAFHFLRTNHVMTRQAAEATLWTEHSSYLNWNGRQIHVIEEGQGTPIFLVHGLGGNCREYDDIVPLLADSFRVVRFDLPGFGLSQGEGQEQNAGDIDYPVFYQQFMEFMLNTYGGDSLVLVGNSLGGWISWESALRYPEKINKLVLLAPAGYEMKKIAEDATGWLKNPVVLFLIAKGLNHDVAIQNVQYSIYNDAAIDSAYYDYKYAASNLEGNLDWMIDLATYPAYADTTKIAAIRQPTLVVWGDKDEVIPFRHAEKFHRDIPNSQLVTYADCGHIPQIEYPTRLVADMRAFIINKQ